jgi:hypothetical protein
MMRMKKMLTRRWDATAHDSASLEKNVKWLNEHIYWHVMSRRKMETK